MGVPPYDFTIVKATTPWGFWVIWKASAAVAFHSLYSVPK